jgi:hypothetical protein
MAIIPLRMWNAIHRTQFKQMPMTALRVQSVENQIL